MAETIADVKEITTAAVELACRAPSLHNSQPWRWVASSTSVDLFVDPHRTVTSTDPSGREAIISCGAALHHFEVAMAAVGWAPNVERFPNPNNLDHLASVDFALVDYILATRPGPAQPRRCDTASPDQPSTFSRAEALDVVCTRPAQLVRQ